MASTAQIVSVQEFAAEVGVPLTVDGRNGFYTRRFVRMFQSTFALGRYEHRPLVVDGDPGLKTSVAVEACRQDRHAVTAHFVYSEWLTSGSRRVSFSNHVLRLERETVLAAERLRQVIDRPLFILSAYRDPVTNRRVGGAVRSQHLFGRAFDIDRVKTGCEVTEAVARAAGFNGVGMLARSRPGRDVIHVDTRATPARWFYR